MKTMKTVENQNENHCRTNENLKTLDSLNIKRILILFHIYKCKGFQGFHAFCNGFQRGFQRFSWLSHVSEYNQSQAMLITLEHTQALHFHLCINHVRAVQHFGSENMTKAWHDKGMEWHDEA